MVVSIGLKNVLLSKGFEKRAQIISGDSSNPPCERLLRVSLLPKVMDVCEAVVQQVHIGEKSHSMKGKTRWNGTSGEGKKGCGSEQQQHQQQNEEKMKIRFIALISIVTKSK